MRHTCHMSNTIYRLFTLKHDRTRLETNANLNDINVQLVLPGCVQLYRSKTDIYIEIDKEFDYNLIRGCQFV